MELIELTTENCDQYLDQCIEVQKHLVQSGETIDREQFIRTATAPHNYFVALIEEGQIAGLGVINKIVHPVRINGYIDNIVVHPDFRGRGLFTTLMNALEAKAIEWGAAQIKLSCSRVLAQSMYERRGYVEKDTKHYIKEL